MTRRKRVRPGQSLVALADLNRAISNTPEHRLARQAVLARFARLDTNGVPVLCQPPRRELLMDRVPGAFKVIYESEDAARDAARELAFLGGPPQVPYLCSIVPDGHLHLHTHKDYEFEKGPKG